MSPGVTLAQRVFGKIYAIRTGYGSPLETATLPDSGPIHDEPDCFAHKAISDRARHRFGLADPKSFAAKWAFR